MTVTLICEILLFTLLILLINILLFFTLTDSRLIGYRTGSLSSVSQFFYLCNNNNNNESIVYLIL